MKIMYKHISYDVWDSIDYHREETCETLEKARSLLIHDFIKCKKEIEKMYRLKIEKDFIYFEEKCGIDHYLEVIEEKEED